MTAWRIILIISAISLIVLGAWRLFIGFRTNMSPRDKRLRFISGFGAILVGATQFLPRESEVRSIAFFAGMVMFMYGLLNNSFPKSADSDIGRA